MPDAVIMLRHDPHYRRDAFIGGLQAAGYTMRESLPHPQPDDVLVVWNRYGATHTEASRWTHAGARVVVAENGYLGRDWRGQIWYAMALNWHMGRGTWPVGDASRARALFAEPLPWQPGAGPLLVLEQRGIGAPGMIAPAGWLAGVLRDCRAARVPVQVRAHPGNSPDTGGLLAALRGARGAVTWSSGAGIKAILNGTPVYHGMPDWIAASAARLYRSPLPEPFTGDRWPMLTRLAWAMWELSEIGDGRAFNHLLCRPEEALQRRTL